MPKNIDPALTLIHKIKELLYIHYHNPEYYTAWAHESLSDTDQDFLRQFFTDLPNHLLDIDIPHLGDRKMFADRQDLQTTGNAIEDQLVDMATKLNSALIAKCPQLMQPHIEFVSQLPDLREETTRNPIQKAKQLLLKIEQVIGEQKIVLAAAAFLPDEEAQYNQFIEHLTAYVKKILRFRELAVFTEALHQLWNKKNKQLLITILLENNVLESYMLRFARELERIGEIYSAASVVDNCYRLAVACQKDKPEQALKYYQQGADQFHVNSALAAGRMVLEGGIPSMLPGMACWFFQRAYICEVPEKQEQISHLIKTAYARLIKDQPELSFDHHVHEIYKVHLKKNRRANTGLYYLATSYFLMLEVELENNPCPRRISGLLALACDSCREVWRLMPTNYPIATLFLVPVYRRDYLSTRDYIDWVSRKITDEIKFFYPRVDESGQALLAEFSKEIGLELPLLNQQEMPRP